MLTYDSLCKEKLNLKRCASEITNATRAINAKRNLNKTNLFGKVMTTMRPEVEYNTPETVGEYFTQTFRIAAMTRPTGAPAASASSHLTLEAALEENALGAELSDWPKLAIEKTTKRINTPKAQHQRQQQCGNRGDCKPQPQPTVRARQATVMREKAAATALIPSNESGWCCNDVCLSSNVRPRQKYTFKLEHQLCELQKQEQEQQQPKQKAQHKHHNEQQQQQQQPQQQQQQYKHQRKSANISRCMSNRSSNICATPTHTSPSYSTSCSDNATTIISGGIADNNAIIMDATTKQPPAASSLPGTSPAPAAPAAPAATAATATAVTVAATASAALGKAQQPLRRLCHAAAQMPCMLRAALFSFVFIMSLQYQIVAASTSMMAKHEPMFISRSETFKFVASDTIVLPCEVANTDPYVVAWKRGIAILTAGSVKVTPDPRVRLVNGFNLQIRDAVPQDAGDYICQIATMEPREITHTVEILVPPRIHHISTTGHLQVKKGSSVRIECSASGNPTPNVTWSRKNNILPNGEEKLHSHILSIENVDRHKGGVYICTANNGVGQPASSQVVLHVLYPPEITVERPVVFSGEGHEAMLVCIVHGETQPEVIWFKDTMQLDTTERHIMENRGSRHTLIIRKVHPQDFGNYSCVAENQLGKSRKTLQLSGKPNVAVFNSPPISQYKDRYNISWTVESHTPIEEYKLSFRRLQQGQEVDNSIDSHSSSSSSSMSSSMLQMYGGSSAHNYRLGGGSMSSLGGMGSMGSMGSMGNMGGYGSYGNIHWGRNEWRDVVLPAIPISHHYTQGMSYMIRGLDPDQHYEATVQARNRYGWSDYSQNFVFSTSSNDNEMRDLSVTFYGSASSRLGNAHYVLSSILLVFCMRYMAV